MEKFTVYFEIYGRKLKTDVIAMNEEQAKMHVTAKIKFFKVVKKKSSINDILNEMEEFIKTM